MVIHLHLNDLVAYSAIGGFLIVLIAGGIKAIVLVVSLMRKIDKITSKELAVNGGATLKDTSILNMKLLHETIQATGDLNDRVTELIEWSKAAHVDNQRRIRILEGEKPNGFTN